MGASENIATAKRGYAAFTTGDAAAAMTDLTDDIEWVTPGNSAIGGTTHGKQELGANWAKLAEKGFTTSPQYWFADEERVGKGFEDAAEAAAMRRLLVGHEQIFQRRHAAR